MSARLDDYRRQLAHEAEAHRRVVESIATVPVANLHTPAYHRALDRFEHVLLARDMWLCRLMRGEKGCPMPPEKIFTEGAEAETIAAHAERVSESWAAYMGGLDEPGLDRVIEYQSTEGSAWSSTVAVILTHAYTHGFYHRGQVATLIAQSGGTPAVQDYILFGR